MVVVETITAAAFLLKAVEAVSQAAEAGGGAHSLFKGIDNIIRAKAKADADQPNADQSLTVESVASEVLLRRKAEVRLSRLATRVDALHGKGTWTSILEARQAKLDARDAAIQRRADRKQETHDTIVKALKELGAIIVIVSVLALGVWTLWTLKCKTGTC